MKLQNQNFSGAIYQDQNNSQHEGLTPISQSPIGYTSVGQSPIGFTPVGNTPAGDAKNYQMNYDQQNNYSTQQQVQTKNSTYNYENTEPRISAAPKNQQNINSQNDSKIQQSRGNANPQQVIPDWYENKRIPTISSYAQLDLSQSQNQQQVYQQQPYQQQAYQQYAPVQSQMQSYVQTPQYTPQIVVSQVEQQRQSPKKIFNTTNQRQRSDLIQPDQRIVKSSENLQSNLKQHQPIFSSNNLTSQNFQPTFENEISTIQDYSQDKDQIKKQKQYKSVNVNFNENEEQVKRSNRNNNNNNNINNNSNNFNNYNSYNNNNNNNSYLYQSPQKSDRNNNSSRKIFFQDNNNQQNLTPSQVKNYELLNSEERIKKSKIFDDQSRILTRSNFDQRSPVQEKQCRETALKEQELKKLTLEQVFCQNCLEFINYETTEVIDYHTQNCRSIEESCRILTRDFIQKERDLHNSFIDETDQQSIMNQQMIQIINTKLEKLRYLFMKKTNVLEESDFLCQKPEVKVYNLVEIKKSLEKIKNQDQDYRFIQSCLNNIITQTKEVDFAQQLFCTPESTQFLQIIKTIPEVVYKKIELLQKNY